MDSGRLLHDVLLAQRLLNLMQSHPEAASAGTNKQSCEQPRHDAAGSAAQSGPAHRAAAARPSHQWHHHAHGGMGDASLDTAAALLQMLSASAGADVLDTPTRKREGTPPAARPQTWRQPPSFVPAPATLHPPSRHELRMVRACVRATMSAGRFTGVTTVCRVLTSTTYLRRMFVTEAMAIIMGIGEEWDRHHAGRPGTGAWTERRLAVTVYDALGRAWQCEYAPRSEHTLTGQLGGQWCALCAANGARLGGVVRFEGLAGRGAMLAVRMDFFEGS